jgi:FkbM family methyltransferase
MSVTTVMCGKWQALRSAAQFACWFRNWREVFDGYRGRIPMPPLRFRGGLTLFHEPSDDPIGLFREVFVEQCYTADGFYVPQPNHVVLDLGANIGTTMLYLSRRAPGICIHCFEPSSRTRRKLEKNVRENHLEQSVTVHPLAVSNAAGSVRLFAAPSSGHGSTVESEFVTTSDYEDVPCISLPEALLRCRAETIDLLKIDVEGSEIEILKSLPANALTGVRRVAVEFHDRFRAGSLETVQSALRLGGLTEQVVDYATPDRLLGVVRASRPR